MALDVMKGFQVGQQIAGTSSFGHFAAQLAKRKLAMDQTKQEVGLKIGGEMAINQAKVESDPFLQSLNDPNSSGTETSGVNPLIAAAQKKLPPGVSYRSPGGLNISSPVVPASIQGMSAQNQSSISNVDQLETLAKNSGLTSSGMLPQMGAVGLAKASGGRINPNIRLYLDYEKSMAAGIYRSLTGDTRLSDRDAGERARPLLWRPELGEPYMGIGNKKFTMLREAMKNRQKLIASGQYITNENGDLITPIDQVLPVDSQSELDDFESPQ